MNQAETNLLESWLNDPSFVAWAKGESPEAIEVWGNYLLEHPDHKALMQKGKELIVGIPLFKEIPPEKERTEKALQRILQTQAARQQFGSPAPVKPLFQRIPRVWSIAASIAIFLVLGSLVFFQSDFWKIQQISTDYGEKRTVVLTDGSMVMLNAHSSLEYHRDFPRKVKLEGEAFFEVSKKPETGAEFKVLTEDLTVTVLGTSFNVNSRNEQTRVYLDEGKVNLEIQDLKDTVSMVPGDMVSFSRSSQKLETRSNVASELNTAWMTGSLLFDHEPIRNALKMIEEIYGIHFQLREDQLIDDTLNGGVPINDLDITLETLRSAYNINIEKEGEYYLIH